MLHSFQTATRRDGALHRGAPFTCGFGFARGGVERLWREAPYDAHGPDAQKLNSLVITSNPCHLERSQREGCPALAFS